MRIATLALVIAALIGASLLVASRLGQGSYADALFDAFRPGVADRPAKEERAAAARAEQEAMTAVPSGTFRGPTGQPTMRGPSANPPQE